MATMLCGLQAAPSHITEAISNIYMYTNNTDECCGTMNE